MENGSENAARKGSNTKRIAAIVIAIAVLAAAGAFAYTKGWLSAGSIGEGKTVALVNGTKLGEKELNFRYGQVKAGYEAQGTPLADETAIADIKQKIVQEMINEEIVVQEAGKAGLSVSDEEVSAAYDQIKSQVGDESAFQTRLEELDLSAPELRTRLSRELLIQKYVEQFAVQQNIGATEEEIAKLYQDFTQGRTDAPELKDVRAQVEQEVKRQKLSQMVMALVESLKQRAEIEVLI